MMEQRRKALLIGVNINNQENFKETLEELKNLTIACGLEVVGQVEQNLKVINKAYYIGSGKVDEVKRLIEEKKADVVIFDDQLSPSQLRNLEKTFECNILDRTSLILEIFAQRAKTREAKLQVEVARLKYMLPRLIGSNENLGRQSGGVGTKNRGAGEKKLELDRRKIEEKIAELTKELELIVKERQNQRKQRRKAQLPMVSLVGYTNAGKSTLMNAMIEQFQKGEDKKVFEKDMLFATLETSVRKITLPNSKSFLLSDTVGFVNKLPHELVKAFRSTLEEVREAQLLLHVVDFSNPNYELHIKVTLETLEQIGADEIPILHVYNKGDLALRKLPYVEGNNIYISARNRVGIEELVQLISRKIFKDYVECKMLIPYNQGKIVSYLNENAHVKAVSYEDEGTLLIMECKEKDYKKFQHFVINS